MQREKAMFEWRALRAAAVALATVTIGSIGAQAGGLKDEIAPSGKLRVAQAHLKKATVTGYDTFQEIFWLIKAGELDAFALSRDQLNAMAKQIPGTKVLDETFQKTVTVVAVPLNHPQALAFVSKFMTD